MKHIPFYKAMTSERELELIKQAFNVNSNEMIGEFEKTIKKFFNTKYALSTNNGTAAIHLVLCAMGLKRADKFICSVNSFPNIAQSIRHFDAEPIFVDINTDDFNVNIDAFEKTLKENKHKKLKGAFISHIAGQPAQMKEIYELAKTYDIKILDDSSRAMGVYYEQEKIGSIKDSFASCFQINPQAQDVMATSGFFITNDEELYKRAKLIRNNAIVSDGLDKDGNLNYIYDVVDIGYKYDLTAICAAYSIAQFEKFQELINRRKEIAKIYDKELKDCTHITTPVVKRDHVYTQYIIKIDKNRDNFAKKLQEKGISTSLHYIPLHLLSYYRQKYGFKVNDFPNALQVYQQVLSLPIYAALSDEDVYYICDQVKNIAKDREY